MCGRSSSLSTSKWWNVAQPTAHIHGRQLDIYNLSDQKEKRAFVEREAPPEAASFFDAQRNNVRIIVSVVVGNNQ